MLHGSVLVDDEPAAAAPRRRDGGREQRRPAGELKGGAVCTLVIAVDEGDGVLLVLPLQRRERRIVRHMLHRHAAVGENGQPLGVDGGIDLVRFTGDGLRQLRQAAEAPKETQGICVAIFIIEIKTDIIPALHPGVAGAAGRRYADPFRQIGLDGAVFIVLRQSHKGIGPVVAVRIDLGDVNAVLIARPGITLGNSLCIQILHGRGDGGTFRGDRGSRSI